MPEGQRERDAHGGGHGDDDRDQQDTPGELAARPAPRAVSVEGGDEAAQPGDRVQRVGRFAEERVEKTGQQHRRGGQGPGLDHGRVRTVAARLAEAAGTVNPRGG
jgi:hypothetical protein